MKIAPIALSVFLAATCVAAEEPRAAPAKSPPIAAAKAAEDEDLYSLGKSLFEALAPDDIKAEYEFVSRDEWNALTGRLQQALESGTLTDLADCAPAVRSALESAKQAPEAADLIAWLEERLDLAEAAAEAVRAQPPSPAPSRPTTPDVPPSPLPARPGATSVPHLDLWKNRLANRPVPPRAGELMPALKAAFVAEGVPSALVWLVEVESAFNPTARSPAGAKGLFQLMPATAQSLGLSTLMPDERTHPAKSAQAAARLLRTLYQRFADWPLVLAAYNAGEGRVRRALSARDTQTFAGVSSTLPAETQLYVPKVMATISLREGTDPEKLGPPK